MRINRITLFNYGPFHGENVLQFNRFKTVPAGSKRNIILIGGKNGSGKTSIFTALQVCLYGQSALGNKVSTRVYEEFLKSQIHHTHNLFPITTAAVEVDFDFSISGSCKNYCVKRTWDVDSRHVKEHLKILKNGKPLDNYEQSFWQDFLKQLLPQGLLKLFFFDAEKINVLTQENNDFAISQSIQTLFGLDIIKQLRADLRNFERKKIKTNESKTLKRKLTEKEAEISEFDSELDNCRAQQAAIRTKSDTIIGQIQSNENRLRALGGITGNPRAVVEQKISNLSMEIEEKSKSIREFYQLALPLYHAKEFLQFTLRRIEDESEWRKRTAFKRELTRVWPKCKKNIEKFLKGKNTTSRVFDALIEHGQQDKIAIVHDDLSEASISDLNRWFSRNSVEQKKQVGSLAKDIEKKQRTMTNLAKKLEYTPNDNELATYIEKINILSKKKGILEGKLQYEEQKEKELLNKMSSLTREKEKLEESIDSLAANDRKLNLVSKSIKVLQTFEKEIINSKINDLECNILTCFNALLRKGDMAKSLKIDKNRFEVVLKDTHGREIKKHKLSEGEKQIYAISVLSGITKTSKRTLPILFDTPLGRLDGDHRSNVIHRYFPEASHQLILLSTDKEVDQQYFDELRPYLLHSYLLDFDMKNRRTVIKEGYFWK